MNSSSRRSMGANINLKPPSVKMRHPSAPVSLQGWLHKQGSDGFMLWKKRWFVLSEFCLFYYKNSQEDKILGSILLPSYKISPCTAAEGKLFRKKYSFKAEHANMRTYYFAADTKESMQQWMNALSLATILQKHTNQLKPSFHSESNGVMMGNRAKSKGRSKEPTYAKEASYVKQLPIRNAEYVSGRAKSENSYAEYPISTGTKETSFGKDFENNYPQPLYANAPPKPRRTTECSDQERSPEHPEFQAQIAQPQYSRYYHQNKNSNNGNGILRNDGIYPMHYVERPVRDANVANQSRRGEDYEELYNLTGYGQHQRLHHNRKFAPRPRSADFLEYRDESCGQNVVREEATNQRPVIPKRCETAQGTSKPQPPRPKSSIEISESFHWSEKSYAEKMRKSARFLAVKTGRRFPARATPPIPPEQSQGRVQSEFVRSISARIPNKVVENVDHAEEVIMSRRNSLHHASKDPEEPPPIQQREESMKRLLEWKQRMLQSPLSRKSSGSSNRGTAQNEILRNYKPGDTHLQENLGGEQSVEKSWQSSREVYHGGSNLEEGKREGSENVLEAVITRKMESITLESREIEENVDFECVETSCEGEKGDLGRWVEGEVRGSENLALGGWSTRNRMNGSWDLSGDYVSEGLAVIRKKDQDTFSSVCNSSGRYDSDSSQDDDKIRGMRRSNRKSADDFTKTCYKETGESETSDRPSGSKHSDSGYDTLKNNEGEGEEPPANIVQNLRKVFEQPEKCEKIDHDIIHDPEKLEGHYLTMATSKRPVFAAPGDLFSHTRTNSASSASQILILEALLSEDVENSYVEMMMENGDDRNGEGGKTVQEKSHYEYMYKASEPVYMEVSGVLKREEGSRGGVLPDILNNSQSQLKPNTDSSDADDEASKELEGVDAPRHPRFSLSDTFRPASYYLGGADRILSDQPDSSDSDLVSPPPIPTSPPPLDDLDTSLMTSLESRFSYSAVYGTNGNLVTPLPGIDSVNYDEYLRNLESYADGFSVTYNGLYRDSSPDKMAEKGAPYYYGDILASGKVGKTCVANNLNNQREMVNKCNNVGRRVNAINCREEEDAEDKLVARLKNTAQFIMEECDKNALDDKNIYSSEFFQRQKLSDSYCRSKTPEPLSDAVNLYSRGKYDDSYRNTVRGQQEDMPKRRTRSLEGLLEDKVASSIAPLPPVLDPTAIPTATPDIWEEDALWRENLRSISLRHARSLDDLDVKPSTSRSGRQSADMLKSEEPIQETLTREATYVNDCVSAQMRKAKQNPKEYTEDYREARKMKRRVTASNGVEDYYERLDPRATLRQVAAKQHGKFNAQPITGAQSFLERGVYAAKPPPLTQPSFEIDREKLRQWDLMSSAPAGMISAGQKSPHQVTMQTAAKDDTTPPSSPASGSVSMIGRDPLPPRSPVTQRASDKMRPDFNQISPNQPYSHVQSQDGMHGICVRSYNEAGGNGLKRVQSENSWNLNVSAGELLGRTHEELVLLLIQLRRQSAAVCKAMESCHRDIESQARLVEMQSPNRLENLHRLDELRKKLLELEKQYEKGKPLVNLVDNMVKLGSLYRAGASMQGDRFGGHLFREKLEFNHRMQEQRMLAEERKDWERLSPDHNQLQAKVEELYKLDRVLQQESSTLQSLKQDKDLLENALGGLKTKLQTNRGNSQEWERYRRQQHLLERELSHVRSILSRNSKKLEETVTANARLESELTILRQKLQWNRYHPESYVGVGGPSAVVLESELKRVQMLVGDLQRQRLELSTQVSQLTEKSKSLTQQAGVSKEQRRKPSGTWVETDLDTEMAHEALSPTPLYVYTDEKTNSGEFSTVGSCGVVEDDYSPLSCGEGEDGNRRFFGGREKPQEIKTVRIVKRESERRQRDRDRNGNLGIPVTAIVTAKRISLANDPFQYQSSHPTSSLSKVMEDQFEEDSMYDEAFSRGNFSKEPVIPTRSDSASVFHHRLDKNNKMRGEEDRGNLTLDLEGTHLKEDLSNQLSPTFQSESAKKIVQELVRRPGEGSNRRLIPKEKRRHHTVSSSKPLIFDPCPQTSARSRDDVDMERALRPRLNGTPDVVRSTLPKTDSSAKYNAQTIDSILGTPGKILIPERYVPERAPQLTEEEIDKRLKKAEAIRRMLSDSSAGVSKQDHECVGGESHKKAMEEKKQREHLLHLNQILAQQVMEKSKQVAVAASQSLAYTPSARISEKNFAPWDDYESPPSSIPVVQQRENFFT